MAIVCHMAFVTWQLSVTRQLTVTWHLYVMQALLAKYNVYVQKTYNTCGL